MSHDIPSLVNQALTQKQQREQLTDQALAERLSIDPVTLWRWRKGKISAKSKTLISLILHEHPTNDCP